VQKKVATRQPCGAVSLRCDAAQRDGAARPAWVMHSIECPASSSTLFSTVSCSKKNLQRGHWLVTLDSTSLPLWTSKQHRFEITRCLYAGGIWADKSTLDIFASARPTLVGGFYIWAARESVHYSTTSVRPLYPILSTWFRWFAVETEIVSFLDKQGHNFCGGAMVLSLAQY